jgi:hypothetical protein
VKIVDLAAEPVEAVGDAAKAILRS